MKKISLLIGIFLVAAIAFQACSPKTTNGAIALKKSNVTGNWVLTNISYEGIAESSLKTIFGEAAPKCFIDSKWSLTNSGNGNYALNGGVNCEAKTQPIYWSVSTADETFQFKKLFEGDKARNVTEGYRLILDRADGLELSLKSPVENGAKVGYFVLHFVRAPK